MVYDWNPSTGGEPSRRYQHLRRLATARTRFVYTAVDLATGERVVLKKLRAAYLPALIGEARRLIVESAAVANGRFGLTELAGEPYLVMRHVPGDDLASYWIREESRRAPELRSIIAHTCQRVHDFHSRGLLHLDLKPSNIIVTQSGEVQLIDFELSEWISSFELPEKKPRGGTKPYRAPESVKGEACSVRSDVYSLGMITYDMNRRVATKSQKIERVILKATAWDPAERFEDAAEMAIAIDDCRSGRQKTLQQRIKRLMTHGCTYDDVSVVPCAFSNSELEAVVFCLDREYGKNNVPPVIQRTVADAYCMYAQHLLRHCRFLPALIYGSRGIELLRRCGDGRCVQVELATWYNVLTDIFVKLEMFPEGLRAARQMVTLRQSLFENDDPFVAQGLNCEASLLLRMNRPSEAAKLYAEAVQIWGNALGSDDNECGWGLNNLASANVMLENFTNARSLARAANCIKTKELGDTQPETSFVLGNLARISSKLGDGVKADELFGRALAIRERELGTFNYYTTLTRNLWVESLIERGEARRAIGLLRPLQDVEPLSFLNGESIKGVSHLARLSRAKNDQRRYFACVEYMKAVTTDSRDEARRKYANFILFSESEGDNR